MKNLIIKKNIKIGEALKKISDGGHRCLVVSNSSKILLGTLSDGDLRRAIIKGYNLNSNISKIYKKNPRFVVNDNFIYHLSLYLFSYSCLKYFANSIKLGLTVGSPPVKLMCVCFKYTFSKYVSIYSKRNSTFALSSSKVACGLKLSCLVTGQ